MSTNKHVKKNKYTFSFVVLFIIAIVAIYWGLKGQDDLLDSIPKNEIEEASTPLIIPTAIPAPVYDRNDCELKVTVRLFLFESGYQLYSEVHKTITTGILGTLKICNSKETIIPLYNAGKLDPEDVPDIPIDSLIFNIDMYSFLEGDDDILMRPLYLNLDVSKDNPIVMEIVRNRIPICEGDGIIDASSISTAVNEGAGSNIITCYRVIYPPTQ